MDSIFMMKSKVGGSYSIIESKEEPNYKTLVLRMFSSFCNIVYLPHMFFLSDGAHIHLA